MAQEKESKIITDILNIKALCEEVLGKLEKEDIKRVKADLILLFRFDLDELKRIQDEFGDEELIRHCRGILYDVRTALRELENKKGISSSEAQELVRKILLVENYDLAKVTNYERFEPAVQKEFFQLLEVPTLSREDVDAFLVKIKGRISPKAFKKIQNTLAKKVEEEPQYDRGPVCKENELEHLAMRIREFFVSPYARDIPKGEKVTFYLSGSLVTGYGTNPGHLFYKIPTDVRRLSDVDIIIQLSPKLWTEITQYMNRKQILTVHGVVRTLPVGIDTHPGPESTGPFAILFRFLQGMRLAGRNDRPVHLIFLADNLMAKMQIAMRPHKHIITITT